MRRSLVFVESRTVPLETTVFQRTGVWLTDWSFSISSWIASYSGSYRAEAPVGLSPGIGVVPRGAMSCKLATTLLPWTDREDSPRGGTHSIFIRRRDRRGQV